MINFTLDFFVLYYMGYVYRFLDKYENVLYIGSCSSFKKRMKQHFTNGHLKEDWYNNVAMIEYSKFSSRTEAYMYEIYNIATIAPPYNTIGKDGKNINLECFKLIKLPEWDRFEIQDIKRFINN